MSAMPQQWSRLSSRVIWLDLVITGLSLIPALIATQSDATIWPLIGIAAVGVLGAVLDAVRWVFTFYRITDSHIELRTGVIFRQHRSIPLDRIRSVDIEAKLRHRIAGLRMINVGAGQQSTTGETAFTLDALSVDDAVALQQGLLNETPVETDNVLATFRPGWVVYNMFHIWAFLMAAGLIAGAWGIASLIGVDIFSLISGLYDWSSLGWMTIAALIVIAVTLLGWIGLTVNYFTEFWNFELSRVPGPGGMQIRTRKGLFTTREVNRSENRIRGVQIAEPLLYRWLGVTDTHVITTGLDMSSMSDPAAVLPRTDGATARRIALEVIDEKDPLFDVPLTPHPTRALRRRLWWATLLAILITALFAVFAPQFLLAAPVIWVLLLILAWVAYRNLGHAVHGPYLIMRSGLLTRRTVIVRREAVSTIAETESVLQKRLGLRSLKVMTAAGHGTYDIPDVDVRDSTDLAVTAAPGVLEEFSEVKPRPESRSPKRRLPAPDLARGVMLLLIAMAYASVYVGAEFGVLVHDEPWWDQVATVTSTLLLDNRAFPMFAILFGCGLAWSVRRQQDQGVDEIEIRFSLRRRAWMLFAIGLIHAILVYSGEILTSYALAIFVTGWMIFRLTWVLTRGAIITAVAYLFTVTAGMMFLAYGRMSDTLAIVPGYTTADDWIERIAGAPFVPFYLAVSYPLFLLVILGYIAARRDLFENPPRALALTGISVSVLGAIPSALIFVGVWQPSWMVEGAVMALQVLTGIAGGAGYVALFALYSDKIAKWCGAIMAVGKRSLTFYLLNSIIVAVVLHRDLIGLQTGALGAMGVAFGAWLISVGLAALLEKAGKQGPMEALMQKVVK